MNSARENSRGLAVLEYCAVATVLLVVAGGALFYLASVTEEAPAAFYEQNQGKLKVRAIQD